VEVGAIFMFTILYSDTLLEINPIVTCHVCGLKQCFKHKAPWHEGLTCEQWDEKVKQDVIDKDLTDELVKTTTKPCPKEGCGRRVMSLRFTWLNSMTLTMIFYPYR
jgi:hypothetical protein